MTHGLKRFARVVRWAAYDASMDRGRACMAIAGVALGVALLVMMLAMGMGIRQVVLQQIGKTLPIDMIEVVPRTMDMGFLKIDPTGLLGGQQTTLDDAALTDLAGIAHVAHAYPKIEVRIPMGAQGGSRLFGHALYTDLFMTALPEELIQAHAGPDFMDQGAGVIPVVISDQLIDIYNTHIASVMRTPRLNASILTGFEFDIVLGRSLMMGSGTKAQGIERGRIVGTSPYAMRLGATIPMTTAKRLLALYGDPATAQHYASVLLKAEHVADVAAIVAAVRAKGWSIDDTAARTSDMLTLATMIASCLGLAVLTLAALNMAHSFLAGLSARQKELALVRALGARGRDVVLWVLLQAAALGFLGGCVGIVAAWGLGWCMDYAMHAMLPSFPLIPVSLFVYPTWICMVGMTAAVLSSILGALGPALAARHASVARTLSLT